MDDLTIQSKCQKKAVFISESHHPNRFGPKRSKQSGAKAAILQRQTQGYIMWQWSPSFADDSKVNTSNPFTAPANPSQSSQIAQADPT